MSDTVNLLAFGTDVIGSADTSGSVSGGHTIENPSGADMTQRSNLQFTDADVADDSTNDRTEISIVRELMQAEFDELTPEEQNRGVIVIKDANPIYVPSNNAVSVTADGVKTYAQLLNELYALVDKNRLTENSVLKVQDDSTIFTYYQLYQITPTYLLFSNALSWQSISGSMNRTMYIASSDSKYTFTTFSGNYQDTSSSVVVSGFTITLYYNTITKVIESCDAEDVAYGSGTVKDVLDGLGTWTTQTVSMTGFLTGTATLYINEKTRQCVLASTSVTTVSSSANSFWAIVARIPSTYIPKYGVVGTLDLTSSDGALFISSMPIHKNNVNDIVASCVPSSISAGLNADFSISWVY